MASPPPNLSQSAQAAAINTAVNAPVITSAMTTPPTDPNTSVNDDSSLALSASASQAGIGNVARFPADTPMYYTILQLAKYNRASWASIGTLNYESAIVLPMPEQIIDTQQVTYETVPIGLPGAGALNLGAAAQNGNMLNALAQALNNSPQAIGAILAKVGVSIEQLASGVLGTGVTAGILASMGLSVNDFLTVMLKGPAYKQFRMTWKLSPHNVAESNSIKQIELLLKNGQAPAWSNQIASFFAWPRIFQIGFYNAKIGSMGDKLYRFKPAVLQASAFNYAPGGVPAFYGASQFPEGVTIDLMFEELEFWINSSADAEDAYSESSLAALGLAVGATGTNRPDL